MQNSKELNRLLIEIKNKDIHSFNELYNLIKVDVFAYAFSLIKNYHEAEDIMQNVFVTLYNKSHLYKEGNPSAYIFTIIKNKTLETLRKHKKEVYIDDDEINKISLIKKDFNHDDMILVKAMLNGLDKDEREIVIMYNVMGYKHKEIADILNLPLGTVTSKYNRSIKKLKGLNGRKINE